MQKTVIVINGAGGVGKDTMCNIAARHYKVRNISSITPIKELAAVCGWKGEKTDRARKFLSDLKRLTVTYSDYPLRWCEAQYRDFLTTDEEILFVHIREAEEIRKFVDMTEGRAVTLLVRGGPKFLARRRGTGYGNVSDDDVENYPYDYYYVNEHSLPATEHHFIRLMDRIVQDGKKR